MGEILLAGIVLLLIYAQPPEVRSKLVSSMTDEQLAVAASDPDAALLDAMLKELDAREAPMEVRKYLELSFKLWISLDDEDTLDTLKAIYKGAEDKEEFCPFYAPCSKDSPGVFWTKSGGEILQVVDGMNMLVNVPTFSGDTKLIWFSGVNTADFVDGDKINRDILISTLWELDGNGTRTYETALGTTKKVMAVQKSDMSVSDYQDLFVFERHQIALQQKLASLKLDRFEKEKIANRKAARTRTWTIDGESITAEFVSRAGKVVTLKRTDNDKQFTTHFSKLSEDDQEFIKKRKWATRRD